MTTRPIATVLAAGVVLLVAATALMVGHGGVRPALASHASDFSLAVSGANCDTKGGPTKCEIIAGAQFTVRVSVNDFSGLIDWDEDTITGYREVWVRLINSAGLTLKNRPGVEEFGPLGAPFWPDCVTRAEAKDPAQGSYFAQCEMPGADPVPPPPDLPESTHRGLVLEADYTCPVAPSSGHTVTLLHDTLVGPTILFDEGFGGAPDPAPSETLTINCTGEPLTILAHCPDSAAGKPVDCSASASGGAPPYTFTWDVGKDGSVDGTGAEFTTSFPVPGAYSIDAIVTDTNGASTRVNLLVTIDPQPNPIVVKTTVPILDPLGAPLANLWLCDQAAAPGCQNRASGVEEVTFIVLLNRPVESRDPKCTGFPNFRPPQDCPFQRIGSFEFEVRFDAKLVDVEVGASNLFGTRNDFECASTPGEGFVQFRCNIKGKPEDAPRGPGALAGVVVRPKPDVRSILIPNQLNGITVQLINQDCQLSDLQGHPIKLGNEGEDPCQDAAVTIRYLEGDVHADCVVDVHDQQQIAFRWGARLGSLLYNERYDLEPSYPKKGDGDIDAKDLQLVYGRFRSDCKNPHPPQDPVDPKAKVEPANPALAAAIREHSTRFGIPADSIAANAKEAVDWPDSCLGLPGPGEPCPLVITPGFRIVLKHDGVTCFWRTNADGSEVRLEGCIA